MTNIVSLAKTLFKRIEWQEVPDDVNADDLAEMIAEAIRWLYTMTGRGVTFDESMFGFDEYGNYVSFAESLKLDEREYVLLKAQIDFLRKAQTSVDTLTSYSTDAMSVSHGDKPYANLQQTITDLNTQLEQVWYKMIRFHLL